jgi:hypothetical protein
MFTSIFTPIPLYSLVFLPSIFRLPFCIPSSIHPYISHRLPHSRAQANSILHRPMVRATSLRNLLAKIFRTRSRTKHKHQHPSTTTSYPTTSPTAITSPIPAMTTTTKMKKSSSIKSSMGMKEGWGERLNERWNKKIRPVIERMNGLM